LFEDVFESIIVVEIKEHCPRGPGGFLLQNKD